MPKQREKGSKLAIENTIKLETQEKIARYFNSDLHSYVSNILDPFVFEEGYQANSIEELQQQKFIQEVKDKLKVFYDTIISPSSPVYSKTKDGMDSKQDLVKLPLLQLYQSLMPIHKKILAQNTAVFEHLRTSPLHKLVNVDVLYLVFQEIEAEEKEEFWQKLDEWVTYGQMFSQPDEYRVPIAQFVRKMTSLAMQRKKVPGTHENFADKLMECINTEDGSYSLNELQKTFLEMDDPDIAGAIRTLTEDIAKNIERKERYEKMKERRDKKKEAETK